MIKFYQWLARHLPKQLVYFCYIRVHAHATCTTYSNRHPDEVNWREALDAWMPEGNPKIELVK
jgi:hypothetical protein